MAQKPVIRQHQVNQPLCSRNRTVRFRLDVRQPGRNSRVARLLEMNVATRKQGNDIRCGTRLLADLDRGESPSASKCHGQQELALTVPQNSCRAWLESSYGGNEVTILARFQRSAFRNRNP